MKSFLKYKKLVGQSVLGCLMMFVFAVSSVWAETVTGTTVVYKTGSEDFKESFSFKGNGLIACACNPDRSKFSIDVAGVIKINGSVAFNCSGNFVEGVDVTYLQQTVKAAFQFDKEKAKWAGTIAVGEYKLAITFGIPVQQDSCGGDSPNPPGGGRGTDDRGGDRAPGDLPVGPSGPEINCTTCAKCYSSMCSDGKVLPSEDCKTCMVLSNECCDSGTKPGPGPVCAPCLPEQEELNCPILCPGARFGCRRGQEIEVPHCCPRPVGIHGGGQAQCGPSCQVKSAVCWGDGNDSGGGTNGGGGSSGPF